MQIRQIDSGKMKAMKELQKPTTPSEINNSYSQFSKAIYESAVASAK